MILDYQQRVLDESRALRTKIHNLQQYIISPKFLELDQDHHNLLLKQVDVMCQYAGVLSTRILLWDLKDENGQPIKG